MSIKRKVRDQINAQLGRRGLELRRDPLAAVGDQRLFIMRQQQVGAVLDVGANAGQYAALLRASGYEGPITSFEPLPDAFAAMEASRADDRAWTGHNVALGAEEAEVTFHVSADSVCSSALPMGDVLTEAIPRSAAVEEIRVPQRRLDGLVDPDGPPLLLKIDTQGFEHQVLDGATGLMPRVAMLEVEMALVELYDGGSTIYDLLPRLRVEGFHAVTIEPGFTDPGSLQTLDVDVTLVRD